MSQQGTTFTEVTSTMASILALAMSSPEFALEHEGGLDRLAQHYGLAPGAVREAVDGGSTPDFLIGLFSGILIGRSQVRAEATGEPTGSTDDFLESLPEAHGKTAVEA